MTRRILIAVCAILLSLPLSAGVVFEIETTDHEQSPPHVDTTEVSAEGRNLKMEIAAGRGGGRGDAIYRGDRREVIVVDHDDKSYVVMDEESIQKIAGQVSQVADQIAEALKNVPEDQRAMVEKMMKERMPANVPNAPVRPKPDIRKTGERGTHAGYPCVKYEVSLDGRKVRELWVTDWGNVEGGDEARDAFLEMADFFSDMIDAFEEGMGGLGGLSDFGADNFFAEIREIDGFPVVTKGFGEDSSLEDESELRSSRRRTLDPADFEPPAGYKRRSMFPQ